MERKKMYFILCLKKWRSMELQNSFWYALKNEACCFELDENQKIVILKRIQEKCFKGKEKIPPNMEQIFFYAATNSYNDSVENFLDRGMDPKFQMHVTKSSRQQCILQPTAEILKI